MPFAYPVAKSMQFEDTLKSEKTSKESVHVMKTQ